VISKLAVVRGVGGHNHSIAWPRLAADVLLLRDPVNLEELNALVGEVLKRPMPSRLALLRTPGARASHDEPNPEVFW